MVPAGYFLLVIFSNYFTVKRGNLAYFSSFLSLLKSNLKKSLICSTHMGPFWIAILILHTKSFQKIFTFLKCLIFCLPEPDPGRLWILSFEKKKYHTAELWNQKQLASRLLEQIVHIFLRHAFYLYHHQTNIVPFLCFRRLPWLFWVLLLDLLYSFVRGKNENFKNSCLIPFSKF